MKTGAEAGELNVTGAGAGAKEMVDPGTGAGAGAGAEYEDGAGELITGACDDVVKGFVFEPEEYTAGPELGAAAGDGAELNEGLGAGAGEEITEGAGAEAGAEYESG